MKSIDSITANLKAFEKKFGFKVAGHQQLSETWFQCHLGVISASNASKAVAKKDSETRFSYMAELVGEVCTGQWEEVNSKHMDWGRQHEDVARSYYEFTTNAKMVTLPLVFKDDSYRVGCSPDGIVSEKRGAEIKCPWNSGNYIKFLVAEKIKPEWQWQQQFTLWVMDAEEWDFVQYDPRMEVKSMKICTTKKDPEKWKAFDDLIPEFIKDMDKMLLDIGVPFGEQWHRIGRKEAEVSSRPENPSEAKA